MDPTTPLESLIPPPTVIDDTNQDYVVPAVCIVLAVLTCLFVGARLTYRFRTKNLGLDDYATIPSTLLYIGWTALAVYVMLAGGEGKPLRDITLDEYKIWFKGIVAITWLYPIMSAVIRASIILFYMRIFTQAHGNLKYVLWVLLGLQGLYFVAFSILPAFLCNPFYMAWEPIGRAPYCSSDYVNNITIALYSTSLVFDVILFVLPLFPISKLHLPLKKRIGVGAIFILGAAASVATAYKLAIYVAERPRMQTSDPDWFDFLMSRFIPVQFDSYGVTVWIPSQIEPTVALIGSSMPALYPLLRSVSKHLVDTVTSRTDSKAHTKGSLGNTGTSSRRFGSRHEYEDLNESQVELQPVTAAKTPSATVQQYPV